VSTFGPRYVRSPALQAAVNHAERASEVLFGIAVELEHRIAHRAAGPTLRELQFCGRASEIEAFVADVVADYDKGIDENAAARTIARFVDDHAHRPIRERLGSEPPCCDECEAVTAARVIGIVEGPDPDGAYEALLVVREGRGDPNVLEIEYATAIKDDPARTHAGPLPGEPARATVDRFSAWCAKRER